MVHYCSKTCVPQYAGLPTFMLMPLRSPGDLASDLVEKVTCTMLGSVAPVRSTSSCIAPLSLTLHLPSWLPTYCPLSTNHVYHAQIMSLSVGRDLCRSAGFFLRDTLSIMVVTQNVLFISLIMCAERPPRLYPDPKHPQGNAPCLTSYCHQVRVSSRLSGSFFICAATSLRAGAWISFASSIHTSTL